MRLILLNVFLLAVATQAVEWANIRPIRPIIGDGNQEKKFVPDEPEGRVTGGWEATHGQFPYMVALILDGVGVCGGSLISETVILTAGHCLDGFLTIEVCLGAQNLYEFNEAERVNVISRDTTVHEAYNLFTLDSDIAFVRLAAPVALTPFIELMRLPSRSQVGETFEGATVVTPGWGVYNSSDPLLSPVLKYGESSIISNAECAPFYPENFIIDSMVCSVETFGSPCNSDSGGPVSVTESDGQPTQIGIVSFGSSRVCENGDPAGNTRITSHLDWIETNTGVTIRP